MSKEYMELESFIQQRHEELDMFKQNMILHYSMEKKSKEEWMDKYLDWNEWTDPYMHKICWTDDPQGGLM